MNKAAINIYEEMIQKTLKDFTLSKKNKQSRINYFKKQIDSLK